MGPALERQDPNSRPAPGQPWAPGRVRTARPSHLGSSVVPILLQEAPQASDEGLGQASHSRMGKLRYGDWVDLPSCQRVRGWFLPQPWRLVGQRPLLDGSVQRVPSRSPLTWEAGPGQCPWLPS